MILLKCYGCVNAAKILQYDSNQVHFSGRSSLQSIPYALQSCNKMQI